MQEDYAPTVGRIFKIILSLSLKKGKHFVFEYIKILIIFEIIQH